MSAELSKFIVSVHSEKELIEEEIDELGETVDSWLDAAFAQMNSKLRSHFPGTYLDWESEY